MTGLTCEQARDLAPEYGLGILAADECRIEADEFARLSEDLMEVIPAAEPPPGFDGRVLESLRPRRRQRRYRLVGGVGAALTGAAAAVVAAVLILTSGTHHQPEIKANLVAGGRSVGSFYSEGKPTYLWMSVHHLGDSGTVSCQVVRADGTVLTLGSFDLVDGSGWWATPEPADLGRIASARLVASNGRILAQATFKS
jgi:hypothetical protein